MFNVSRRDLVVSTGLAAAFGLTSRLFVDPAFAQKTPDPAKGFVKTKVGSADVTYIYDGIFEKPHDPAFIANASVDDVKAAMTKAGLPADFVSISGTVAVVQNGGKTILIDAGTGGQAPGWVGGKLAAGMKAAGIDAAKVDTVLISHFHPDHIFGLMEKDTNKAVYPNAEIVVSDFSEAVRSRIRVIPHISSTEELIQVYRANSIFLLPSYFEGQPSANLKTLTALAPKSVPVCCSALVAYAP